VPIPLISRRDEPRSTLYFVNLKKISKQRVKKIVRAQKNRGMATPTTLDGCNDIWERADHRPRRINGAG
jgi:hypothetical protein